MWQINILLLNGQVLLFITLLKQNENHFFYFLLEHVHIKVCVYAYKFK